MRPDQRAWALAGFALLGACDTGPTTQLVRRQFNGEDEVPLQVTAKGPVGEAREVDLTSTTGETVIGTLTIDPGSGPVGTVHRVTVRVGAAWADRIEEAELEADAGERGARTLAFEPDSADERLWVLNLKSVGTDGEARKDVFRVYLYELVEELVVE
ncbi:MAG: hypothetical protein H6732_15585 [Alphaproteobacteria bacterium]|nr:hypothetical protein [Alphaproteobacteria bacterium]